MNSQYSIKILANFSPIGKLSHSPLSHPRESVSEAIRRPGEGSGGEAPRK